MNNEHFVYLLPRTDVAAERKRILVLEKHPGVPVLVTETGSIKQASALIGRIRDSVPSTEIIVDTGASAGRDILYRTMDRLKFNGREFDPNFHLSQLYEFLKGKMPAGTGNGADTKEFEDLAVSMLFSARSTGGRRPCMKGDTVVVRAARNDPEKTPSEELHTDCFLHPLCFVPRFFIEESNRILGRQSVFLKDTDMQDTVRLAVCLSRIRQSPFPIRDFGWLFPRGEAGAVAGLRSRTDDFIHAVLDGTTRTRKTVTAKNPVQSEIVRLVDRLLRSVDIESSRLFSGPANGNRYDRIRNFLDLVFDVWTHSLYVDTEPRPQVMNLGMLNDHSRKRFEQALQPL